MAQAEIDRRQVRTLCEADGERITLDPHRPGKARARLAQHEVPVWALIGHMRGNAWDIEQTHGTTI